MRSQLVIAQYTPAAPTSVATPTMAPAIRVKYWYCGSSVGMTANHTSEKESWNNVGLAAISAPDYGDILMTVMIEVLIALIVMDLTIYQNTKKPKPVPLPGPIYSP